MDLFRADLRAANNLADAFDGVDAPVHLAAAVTGGEDAQFSATVVGTEKLLAAMAKSSCRRLVLASSFSVYDWSKIPCSRFDEESPLEAEEDLYERDGYAVAKMWQERVARRMAGELGWDLTVLRPGFIWGKGNEDLSGIGQRVGRMQMVFGPTRKVPVTHVENCADCFVEATENPKAIGGTFNVMDEELPSAWRYAGEYLRGSGTGGVRVPVPYWVAMNGTRLARRVSKWVFNGKGKLPSILVPCRFEARFKPVKFKGGGRVREALSWRPALGFDECVRRTYAAAAESPAVPMAIGRAAEAT